MAESCSEAASRTVAPRRQRGELPLCGRQGLALPSTKRVILCALELRNPHFRHFEHKIEVFVRFCPSESPFSGFSSTKSRFLCFFGLRNPCFRAFRAQNRHFCARAEGQVASGSVKVTFVQFTARANVPQRCLEQGFVRAVICRKCATDN